MSDSDALLNRLLGEIEETLRLGKLPVVNITVRERDLLRMRSNWMMLFGSTAFGADPETFLGYEMNVIYP